MSADVHGLSGAYAVDALDEREREAFERHLAECQECRDEVAGLREAAAGLSALTARTPSEGLRESVLGGIRSIRPLPPLVADLDGPAPGDPGSGGPRTAAPGPDPGPATVRSLRPRRRVATWLAAAAAVAALVVGGLVWSPWRGSAPPISATEQVLHAPDAQRVERTVDGATTTLVRSVSLGKAVIVAHDMPNAPQGEDFQLWLLQPGTGMVSAGLMPHSHGPTVSVLLQGDAATATAAGITLEPAGGSTRPTTPPLALYAFS